MAEIFLCNLELNSGITLEQIKKSKGLFGKLNDEDYNEPINNLFKFWDEIKKTASSLKIKIEPEIIFCSHSSHQRNLSEDYSQFFMHDFMTNHGQSIQNVLCFDLKENIDFGKLQIENKLKSDINKVNQYQIGVMSIFLGDEKKDITKFQQTLAINLRGNGNAKLSFCEFEETKNISFSSILLNSGKLFGKITGDYNQQKSIDEVAPGLAELSNLFVEISESSILKNKLKPISTDAEEMPAERIKEEAETALNTYFNTFLKFNQDTAEEEHSTLFDDETPIEYAEEYSQHTINHIKYMKELHPEEPALNVLQAFDAFFDNQLSMYADYCTQEDSERVNVLRDKLNLSLRAVLYG
ncbi:hypothetical protein OAS27_04625 [Alphaproteobacteria bacterium]|jgi:hypothetical protein|nr:hypothetical protein [Alphaproteobacteria bacterium]